MRCSWVLVLLTAGVGCARAENVKPAAPEPLPPPPLPSVPPGPPAISLAEVGADEPSAEWTELAMPDDARVLTYAQTVGTFRETWTLAESGTRRVLRLRVEDGKRVASAAWSGTKTKDGMALRLIELRGNVRMPAERLNVTCRRDAVCEEGKPKHRVAVEMCTLQDEATGGAETTFLAPGNGVDFNLGSCPYFPEANKARNYPIRVKGPMSRRR